MHNEKPQIFIDITADELHKRIEDYSDRGWRFVNICGSTVDGGVELIYSFSQGLPLENLRLTIDPKDALPSVSDRFPNAFFFENETHDLFGVRFSGIYIDFNGEFYTVSVPTPMNPASPTAHAAVADNTYGAANYGACPVPDAAGGGAVAEPAGPSGPGESSESGEPSEPSESLAPSEPREPSEPSPSVPSASTEPFAGATQEGGE